MKYGILFVIISSFFLNSCSELALGGATAVTTSVIQERSLGNAVDDLTILTKIKSNFLQKDVNNLLASVSVNVHEGRVLLTGIVTNRKYRVQAVEEAWKVSGIREVINELQVKKSLSAKKYANDSWVTAQVKSKMLVNGAIKSINYSVDTVSGIVYLMGVAQDENELNEVTHLASRVKGVKKVISHVRLKGDPLRG